MRGFPKTINTKQDLENLLAMPKFAGQAAAKLKELEAGRFAWVSTGTLTATELGKAEEGFRVVEETMEGKPVRYQQELKEDPNAPYVRLGLAPLAVKS